MTARYDSLHCIITCFSGLRCCSSICEQTAGKINAIKQSVLINAFLVSLIFYLSVRSINCQWCFITNADEVRHETSNIRKFWFSSVYDTIKMWCRQTVLGFKSCMNLTRQRTVSLCAYSNVPHISQPTHTLTKTRHPTVSEDVLTIVHFLNWLKPLDSWGTERQPLLIMAKNSGQPPWRSEEFKICWQVQTKS